MGERLDALGKEIEQYSSKARKADIEGYYFSHMSKNLKALNVKTVSLSSVEKIDCRVRDTGSDQPRALLAYDFAIYATIKKHSSSFLAPLVIDSPLQQDQDAANSRLMLQFILGAAGPGDQVLLGTASMHGIKVPNGTTILLDQPLKLLRTAEYEAVRPIFDAYFDAVS